MTREPRGLAPAIVALILAGAVILVCAFLMAQPAEPHDSWISNGGFRNKAGEWCCGAGDCFVIPSQHVRLAADGYHLFGEAEIVPLVEAQPSPDGAFWRCKRPDGTRRCILRAAAEYVSSHRWWARRRRRASAP